MFKIGNVEIKNPIIIAPMAGITNGAFRELCYKNGASLVCCEMVSDKAIFYHNKRTLDMLEVDDNYHPVSLQLFGSEVETMVYAAKILDNETNCDIIDINMGCPVNKVIKTGSGSALMLDEDLAVSITKSVIENVKKPVTVKMRLGYTKDNINYLSLAKKLEEVGVSAITLHGRTRSQMYEGKADWSHIKKLKEELNIPVIGNGDIKSVQDFVDMKEYSNVDGIMIGRGVVGNPFLIKEIDNYLNGKENYEVSIDERIEACLKHTNNLIELKGEERAIKEMRGLAPHYISGLKYSARVRKDLSMIDSLVDLEKILQDYKEYVR